VLNNINVRRKASYWSYYFSYSFVFLVIWGNKRRI